MRHIVRLLFLSLALAAGGCSDDDPGGLSADEAYSIETTTPTLAVRQDLTAQTHIILRRGAADTINFPRADTVVLGATGFTPDSLNVATGATVVFSNTSATAHRINFHSTAITDIPPTAAQSFTAGDSARTFPNVGTFRYNCTIHLADTGVVVVHPRARVTYASEDYTIATVDSLGRVTGLRGGTTNILVMANGATLSIPVTVDPYPATEVSLTFMDGSSEGTFFAMPGDVNSSVLSGLVRVARVENGVTVYDTVFCNRCERVNTRTQRVVQFISTDTLKARVSNARNALAPDTSGKVLPLDTTRAAEPLRIILNVPGDNKADTVLVHLKLRPIDSLVVRPDSFVNPATGRKQPFLTTITPDSLELNLGVTFNALVRDAPSIPGGTPGSVRLLPIITSGSQRRTALPPIAWESANAEFATITADGRVFGLRSNAVPNAGQLLTCATTTPPIPAAFGGEGTLTIPNCSPTKTIPRPGVWCNTESTTAVDAFCEVWMRATIVDPVTGITRTDKVAVIITR